MNRKRSLGQRRLLACTIAASLWCAVGSSVSPLLVQARPLGAPPGNHRSGAVRGACFNPDRNKVLTALVDESDPALTTQGNPTFLFYLPFDKNSFRSPNGLEYSVATAEFQLQDENNNSVLKHQKLVYFLPDKPGLVKITLPETEAPLELDKEYFWSFTIICNPNDDNSSNPSVSGWIKRVKPNSSANVWFDRLAQLIESRTNQAVQWTELLTSLNLQDLSQAAIIELKPKAEKDNGGG
ncbi:MAG TPA: DUF928 domain-containing protein [Coleofasciculaceae cyanobacterium]